MKDSYLVFPEMFKILQSPYYLPKNKEIENKLFLKTKNMIDKYF